jgi:putative inorganic carbon (hco3(-)) transporter
MGYLGLLVYFFMDYLRPGYYVPALELIHLNALVPLVIILATLALKTPVSNMESLREVNTRLVGGFFFVIFVSLIFATVTERAYKVFEMVLGYVLIYWALTRQIGDYDRVKGIFKALILVHVTVALLNPVMFTDPEGRHGITSGAFIGDGNDYALSVNICIPFCLFLLQESRSKIAKFGWLAMLLLLVVAIVATKSRGGTVALAAMGLHYWLKSERKAMTASVFAVVVAVILVVAPPSYFERMGTITDTEESSAQGRITAWTEGVYMAVRNPLLGAGVGHFGVAFGAAQGGRWMTAHSIYFLVLGELGLPGISLLLAIIFVNLAVNRRLMREAERLPPEQAARAKSLLMCTSASLIAFASGGAFLSAAYYPHIYVLCGLLAASRHIVRVELEAPHGLAAGPQVLTVPTGVAPLRPGHLSPEWRPRPVFGASRAMSHSHRG